MNLQHLSSTLMSLPISLESKVQLWLAFKNIKPVSTVQFLNPPYSDEKNKIVFDWLTEAGLQFEPDTTGSELIYVSHSEKKAKEASLIMWSEESADLLKKGELFGYPTAAVRAFASNEPTIGLNPKNFQHYWGLYARYKVRPDFMLEDSQIAKQWADVIHEDIPLLAQEFEDALLHADYR